DAQNWQPRAAAHAAAFATALVQELIAEGVLSEPPAAEGGESESMVAAVQNLATGNARVGVQAGQIYGDVAISSGADASGPPNLTAAIAHLSDGLKRAHRDGQLDEETYLAAESELDVTAECLAEDSPGSTSRLMVALKRLRGLVTDVSELATQLVAIIAAAK